MFDFEQVLEDRLRTLQGKPLREIEMLPGYTRIALNDISVEYITKKWTEMGFLDEQGNIRDLVTTVHRPEKSDAENSLASTKVAD